MIENGSALSGLLLALALCACICFALALPPSPINRLAEDSGPATMASDAGVRCSCTDGKNVGWAYACGDLAAAAWCGPGKIGGDPAWDAGAPMAGRCAFSDAAMACWYSAGRGRYGRVQITYGVSNGGGDMVEIGDPRMWPEADGGGP